MKKILTVIFLVCSFSIMYMAEQGSGEEWKVYHDIQGRFTFSYPARFGDPQSDIRLDMPEGDSGESFAFPDFSYGLRQGKTTLEGNLVVRKGRTWVNAQTLGGLYDPLILGSFIDAFSPILKERLSEQAAKLSSTNFCDELSKQEHIQIDDPELRDLPSQQKQALIQLDKMRNLNPKVISCKVDGDVVVFHKAVLAEFGQSSGNQHIYGAISFRKGTFRSIQFIRITSDPPTELLLELMADTVCSFEELN